MAYKGNNFKTEKRKEKRQENSITKKPRKDFKVPARFNLLYRLKPFVFFFGNLNYLAMLEAVRE